METAEAAGPDPEQVIDLEGLVRALIGLRALAGSPPYRALAKQVGPLLRPPREIAFRTVADVFQPSRRRLDLDLVLAVVRALGAGRQVDAWRRAHARAHADAASGGPVGVFRQLPADLPTFIGRREALRRLLAAVDEPRPDAATTVVVSAIEGMAGVGKTQLAVHAAHRLVRTGRCTDVQLYVDLRGFDPDHAPADPCMVLGSFLRQLEVPGPQIPSGLDERAAMYRDVLHDRQALILLDNAADEKQVRDLIPASGGCVVLVTSRRTLAGLDGAAVQLIDVFDEDEAIALLARIAGEQRVQAEPEVAAEIVKACGYLPLAVSLAAARLRSRPTWSLADLAARIHEDDLGTVRIGARSVDAVFDLSYQALPADLRRLYRLLALFPGADFTAAAAAALAGIETSQAQDALEELLDDHLIQQKTSERYALHDLARSYAARRTYEEDDSSTRETAVQRFLTWYLHSITAACHCLNPHGAAVVLPPPPRLPAPLAFTDRDTALAWCEAERVNLAAAVSAAEGDDLAWQLARAAVPYYSLRNLWDDWAETHRIGLSAAQMHQDRLGQAWMHHGLGRARTDLQDPAAADHFRTAQELFGDEYPLEALRSLASLAAFYGQQGDVELLIAYSLRAVEAARRAKDGYIEAILLGNIGTACIELKRFDEGVSYLHAALARLVTLGDEFGQATVLNNLGDTHIRSGKLSDADNCLTRALLLRRNLGDRRGEATTLNLLADLARAREQADEERHFRQAALDIYEDLNDPLAAGVRAQLA